MSLEGQVNPSVNCQQIFERAEQLAEGAHCPHPIHPLMPSARQLQISDFQQIVRVLNPSVFTRHRPLRCPGYSIVEMPQSPAERPTQGQAWKSTPIATTRAKHFRRNKCLWRPNDSLDDRGYLVSSFGSTTKWAQRLHVNPKPRHCLWVMLRSALHLLLMRH